MPVPPSELTAEITIHDEGQEDAPFVQAALRAASSSGLALEAGPAATALSGPRDEVLEGMEAVIRAAVGAGGQRLSIVIEAPSQTR